MLVIASGADTVPEPMPGQRAQEILSGENWDDWPDLDLLGEENPEPDPDDEPDAA